MSDITPPGDGDPPLGHGGPFPQQTPPPYPAPPYPAQPDPAPPSPQSPSSPPSPSPLPPPTAHEPPWANQPPDHELLARPETFEPPPAYVPTGPGAAAHYGSPLAVNDPGAYHSYQPRQTVYAGFWRRLWARWITGLVASVILGVGYSVILFATFWVHENTAFCNITANGTQICERRSIFLWIGLIASWLFGVSASYVIWSRRLATHGGTVGMGQMGISIKGETGNGTISKGRALRRSIIALLPALFSSAASWILLFEPTDETLFLAIIGQIVLSVVVLLGGLWMLVDPQRRTLWDIVGGTVVVVDRDPSWLAVTSLVCGCLVPLAGFTTIELTGLEKLRDEFDAGTDVARLVGYAAPVGIACVASIVFGHLALRATKWDARRLAGRGIAVTGTLLGYSVPAIAVIALGSSFIYDKLIDREARTCQETRKEIKVAAESFKTLNGVYPTQMEQISGAVYLNDEGVVETWQLSRSGDDYSIKGIGDCAKA